MKNYVIIGGGIASLGCIDGIRNYDKDSKITMICKENHLPYSRPLISYYLEEKTTFKKMQYRDKKYYSDNNVEVLLNKEAVDISNNIVKTKDNLKIPYDALLVATGSSPFIPPITGIETVKNKYTFMTIDDAAAIEKNIRKDSRVLIVGAGLIGLKCAEGIFNKVKQITVCDLADRVLSSILDKECADKVKAKLEEAGLKFRLSDSVVEFKGNTAIMKSQNKEEFDILIMAVGVRPQINLLKGVNAEINRGVLVNNKMETSVKGIYCAGDICESSDCTDKAKKIMAILPNAYIGGLTAGENMAGKNKLFDNQIPMNSIGFFGYHIMTAGSYTGELYEEKDKDNIKKLFIKNNKLVGFIILGNVEKTGIYTSLIRNRTSLKDIDFDLVKKSPSLLAFSKKYREKVLSQKN